MKPIEQILTEKLDALSAIDASAAQKISEAKTSVEQKLQMCAELLGETAPTPAWRANKVLCEIREANKNFPRATVRKDNGARDNAGAISESYSGMSKAQRKALYASCRANGFTEAEAKVFSGLATVDEVAPQRRTKTSSEEFIENARG